MKLLKKLAAGFLSLSMIFGAANSEAAAKVEKRIAINSASRLMVYYENNKKIAEYPLGLGKTYTPTPVGYFKILEKVTNPTWIDPSDPEYEVPSGPSNPLGYRWMQILGNYGIHGTNRPESIGGYVSNGCIRMREADVEELYKMVDVGTPVDITYNRVVVEKIEDGNVAYWIYPDGYGWQNIDVAYVNGWLEPYGVAPFESDINISDKIQASDGKPTYVGKPYNIEVNGRRIDKVNVNGRDFLAKAVVRDNINYLPVVPLAMALRTKLEWREGEATLKTKYGTVTGIEKKNQIYCNADDAIILLNIDGGLQNISDNPAEGKVFKFYTAYTEKDKDNDKKKDKKSKEKLEIEKKPAEILTDDSITDEIKSDEDIKAEKKAKKEAEKAKKAAEKKAKKETEKAKKAAEKAKKEAEKKAKENKIVEDVQPVEEIKPAEDVKA